MLILTCPNCGDRSASEFRFGGEYNPRPKDPSACNDEEWTDYLYIRNNRMDMQTEWWYHNAGCGIWVLVERKTQTNQITKTYLWQPNSVFGKS